MSFIKGNSKYGKYSTLTTYSVVGTNGVVEDNIRTRARARNIKQHLLTTIGLKNRELSIVQNSVSTIR